MSSKSHSHHSPSSSYSSPRAHHFFPSNGLPVSNSSTRNVLGIVPSSANSLRSSRFDHVLPTPMPSPIPSHLSLPRQGKVLPLASRSYSDRSRPELNTSNAYLPMAWPQPSPSYRHPPSTIITYLPLPVNGTMPSTGFNGQGTYGGVRRTDDIIILQPNGAPPRRITIPVPRSPAHPNSTLVLAGHRFAWQDDAFPAS
ncbi:hypothetical protein CPB84DRAFT_1772526 [Gymnopilus junonius]|uniref:Uncharacterized protein n=1 Tax=Gymnopilus junonius TaxID=109634 RepID=A0A9P5NTF0_GYMJU|nr:hypothetical protein CPB84DRAFT_1772526 [Gymnopilus junonius]